MRDLQLIISARSFVERKLAGESSGHDWWHIYRVWNVAKKLAELEGADLLTVELAALLHDIADWKFHAGDDTLGAKVAEEWLRANHAPPDLTAAVGEIIAGVTFKGASVATPMRTLEGKIVQDADRLDAIGAIGIARAFAYGGHKGRMIYHPEEPPVMHADFAAYKRNSGHSINHFYEKLLLLKERMNTGSARAMAAARHNFMESYLQQFFQEWHGEL